MFCTVLLIPAPVIKAKSMINSPIIMKVILTRESTHNVGRERERKFTHPVILIRSRFTFLSLKKPHWGMQKFIWLSVLLLSLCHSLLGDRMLAGKRSSRRVFLTVLTFLPYVSKLADAVVDLNSKYKVQYQQYISAAYFSDWFYDVYNIVTTFKSFQYHRRHIYYHWYGYRYWEV